jgi:dCTP deaminase
VILCDIDIHTLARRELATPFDPELVNPASLDVRLGENLLIEEPKAPSATSVE